MNPGLTVEADGQILGKQDPVTLDNHVDIKIPLMQKQVTDQTSHHKCLIITGLGHLADNAEQDHNSAAQPFHHQVLQIALPFAGRQLFVMEIARQTGRVVDQQIQKIGASDHPQQLALTLIHHRDNSLAMLDN